MKTIEMAREAGFTIEEGHTQRIHGYDRDGDYTEELEQFAELIRADEREACAKVCESLFDTNDDSCNEAEQCAEAIRARSNK